MAATPDTSCKGSNRNEPGQLKSLGTDAFIASIIRKSFFGSFGFGQICDKSVRSRQKKLVSEACLQHLFLFSRTRSNVKGVASGGNDRI